MARRVRKAEQAVDGDDDVEYRFSGNHMWKQTGWTLRDKTGMEYALVECVRCRAKGKVYGVSNYVCHRAGQCG